MQQQTVKPPEVACPVGAEGYHCIDWREVRLERTSGLVYFECRHCHAYCELGRELLADIVANDPDIEWKEGE